MSLIVLYALLVAALHVEALSPDFLGMAAHPPDLYVLLVVYLALRAPGYRAIGWSIGIGIVRDAVSLDPIGTNAFVLGMLAFSFCEGRRQRSRIGGLSRLGLVVLGSLAAEWLYLLRILPFGDGVVRLSLFVDALPVALFTALLAATLYPLLDHYRLLDELCGRTRALRA